MYPFSKRIFDIFFSLLGIIILLPVFFIISLFILSDSPGGILFTQKRVGKGGSDFTLFKFRTMNAGSESAGLITTGAHVSRITRVGKILRKNKLDELPQLINVLIGEMSLVGPRPEVRKYVEMYNERQKHVLDIKPGITDYASLQYSNENELLAGKENPEDLYIREIMPAKLELNLQYLSEMSILTDIKIIFKTIGKIFG